MLSEQTHHPLLSRHENGGDERCSRGESGGGGGGGGGAGAGAGAGAGSGSGSGSGGCQRLFAPTMFLLLLVSAGSLLYGANPPPRIR
ncbi:hypothetical protein KI387_043609, partial [Taxus chinensis]